MKFKSIIIKPTAKRLRSKTKKRRILALPTIVLVIAIGLVLSNRIRGQSELPSAPPSDSITSGTESVSEFVFYTEHTVKTAPSSSLKRPPSPTPPNCVKPALIEPVPINLDSAPVGFTQVNSPTQYYRVNGYNAVQIAAQAGRCNPGAKKEGHDYFASTLYKLNWRFDYGMSDGKCALKNIKVGLNVGFIYPAWTSSPQAASNLAASWQRFSSYLMLHENGHRDISVKYAKELLQELEQLTADSCESLTASANQVAQKKVQSLNQANEKYDAETKHGQTQGAELGS